MMDQELQEVSMVNAYKRGHSTTEEDEAITSGKKRMAGKNSRVTRSKRTSPAAASKSSSPSSKIICKDGASADLRKCHNSPPVTESSNSGDMYMEKRLKYDAFSRPPFIVHFRANSVGSLNKKPTPLIVISKKLIKMNIKFTHIAKHSRDTWKVTFATKMLANNALANPLIQDSGITTFIPRFKLCRKVVIKDIPTDIALPEIKEAIEDENQNVIISNLFRLRRRNRETRELEESESICLELKGENCPERLSIWKAIIPVKPYVQSVRLCFKCGRIGHISKYCNRQEACLICAGEHRSSREAVCTQPKKCINCNGSHSAMDRNCPSFKMHMEIARVMAYDNLPFVEARLLVEKGSGIRSPPTKTLTEFPLLKVGSGNLMTTPNTTGRKWAEIASDGGVETRRCNENLRAQMSKIFDTIMTVPEADILCERILKTMDLHIRRRGSVSGHVQKSEDVRRRYKSLILNH